jgi:DNA helicase-2/ATP-dependent DNA helicase PcrA
LFSHAIYPHFRSSLFCNKFLLDPLQGSFVPAYSTSSPTLTAAAAGGAASSYLDGLNAEQLEAVTGPLVPTRVIAGPGSGKTKTLTSRIAHLITHHNARPWQIVAITFTNKAAIEMRERLATALGPEAASELFAGTFHSLCYRILLRSLSLLPDTGRTDGWSIYDADASLAVIYKLVRTVYTDWKSKEAREHAKTLQSRISRIKNGVSRYHGVKPIDVVYDYYTTVLGGNPPTMTPAEKASADDLAEWFEMYEQAMRSANALDFDDLLGYTTAVLRHDVELRERLRRRWRHVLVDEFQDTNSPQYELVKLLAGIDDEKNATHLNQNSNTTNSSGGIGNGAAVVTRSKSHVFVVGDTDQAIYGWRGADVRNMRTLFQYDFPTGEVYRLRDNYRSTPGILTAAQAVISRNNDGDRAGLRAHRPQGPPIRVRCLTDAFEEAESVAREIGNLLRSNTCRDRDIAVLFRTHMQARFIEQQLVKQSIPYVLVGGVSFWRRVEIQDILAYVRLAVTLDDDVALKRVINVPKRGIGDVSLAKLEAAGVESEGGSLCRFLWPSSKESISCCTDTDISSGTDRPLSTTNGHHLLEPLPQVKKLLSAKTAATVEHFRDILLQMREELATQPLSVALQRIIELSEYKDHVEKGGCGSSKEDEEDIQDRLLRLRQLVASATEFRPGTAAGAAALDAAFAAIELEEDEETDRRISQLLNANSEKLLSGGKKESSFPISTGKINNGLETASVATEAPDSNDFKESLLVVRDELLATARAFLDEAALYSGADEGADIDGVRLMTMHAAKGLEFEIVFVPGCVEGLVPLFNPDRGDTQDDLEEETRLFFVSMTRAKVELRLSYTKMNALQGPANRRPNFPSRYLADVVKSGHAVVEEESSVQMMGAARSRKHYEYRIGEKSSKTKKYGARKNTAAAAAAVLSSTTNEWDADSDWIDDEVDVPFATEGNEHEKEEEETSAPLRPAQMRAQKRAERR